MRTAVASLSVKSIDDDERIIEGVATTPTPDRAGDIIEPLGAIFSLPLPMLWQHDQKQPVGQVTSAKVTSDGITIKAQFAKATEAGPLQTRLDDAWQHVKLGLVRGLSIGYKAIKAVPLKAPKDVFFPPLHVKEWEWAELSPVAIPQNAEATILNIKSAAFGRSLSGVSDVVVVRATKDAPKMQTITEQIKAFEATRAAKVARQTELMNAAAADGSTLDADAATEWDTIAVEVKAIDNHLVRARAHEQTLQATATPIAATTDMTAASHARGGTPTITVKANLPPATAFIRYCQAMLVGNGSKADALAFAERWKDSTPEVALALKAAVAAGTTTDATWAGPLVQLKPLADEFLDLLRPQTILGKVPGFKRVPFNVQIASQTGGGTYQWVGQGAPKPVGKLTFGSVTLGFSKCAGIIVITEELARLSSPSAESAIRADMIAGIAHFLDIEFTDPAKAPVANVSPGSITNGVAPITSAGTTPANARTDIQALVAAMVAAGISASGAVLLMSETNALALGNALNPLGQPLFPNVGVNGGTALGITIIASQVVGANVILVQPETVLYADDGGVTIDVSREASLHMDSAPTNPPDYQTVFTSLWQNNLVGLRAERWINWKRARNGGVQYTVQTYAA